jgi:Protein of unknown function (DUF1769)
VKNDFDESIAEKLPTGTSLGLKALRMIDGSLQTDLYCPKPYFLYEDLADWVKMGLFSAPCNDECRLYDK